MGKILSHAERMALFQKQAQEATQQAKHSLDRQNKTSTSLQKIKKSLEDLGYQILDEKILEEIIGKDTSLQFEKISILTEKNAIKLNEHELNNTQTRSPVIFSISEAETPQIQNQQEQKNSFTQSSKTFSVSETEITPRVPQKQSQETHSSKTEETLQRIRKIEEERLKHIKGEENSQEVKSEPSNETPQETQKTFEEKNKEKTIKEEQIKPTPQKEIKAENKKEPLISQPSPFEEKYAQSLKKWCQKTTDKKTGKNKREIKSIQTTTTNLEEETKIEIAPLSPIAAKRGDNGAIYKIKKNNKKNQTDVTLGSREPGQPLNYDYFYALVKAAHDSGADTIEFNNIKTPEFRDKLLAAALQFKMKLKNAPGVINLEAKHLQSIPPGCRHYLELHNEKAKKALKEMGQQITPEKGEKFGDGPKAEERTHAEKESIESQIAMEKAQKAERAREKLEKEINSPSSADYDQHPEKYIKNQAHPQRPKRRPFNPHLKKEYTH